MPEQQAAPTKELRCYKHGRRTTRLRCSICDRPICHECLVETPVSFQCRSCARERGKPSGEILRIQRRRTRRRVYARTVTFVLVAALVAAGLQYRNWSSHPSSAPAFLRSLLPKPAPPPAGPALASSQTDFKFLQVDPKTGKPVRFNPCQPVEYIVNPQGAPPGALTAVNEAAAAISQATGIALVSAGVTSEPPSVNRPNYVSGFYPDKWAPVLIGWLPLGRQAGPDQGFGAEGGPGPAIRTSGGLVSVSGSVLINRDVAVDPMDLQGLLMNSLGYVFGLGNAALPGEIMHDKGESFSRHTWGPGDLAGFAKVGILAGCLPEPKPGP